MISTEQNVIFKIIPKNYEYCDLIEGDCCNKKI